MIWAATRRRQIKQADAEVEAFQLEYNDLLLAYETEGRSATVYGTIVKISKAIELARDRSRKLRGNR